MVSRSAANSQVTDAVSQSNVKVLGEAPSMSQGVNFQTLAHSTGALFSSSVANAQNQTMLGYANSSQGVTQVYSVNTKADAGDAMKIAEIGEASHLATLLTVLQSLER
ncbi:RebB family R body protein [Thalassococcus sp. S3]|uniref:RebB family R body protein n=1 Tax=Thalassococcus sp. S3 TaxID=2017482 RepID=UPI0010245D87|nr:RebB family R body protein [Thalassococcus sp. S3]QBF31187.1 R body protein RebB-like protein [Thalassococcus sp. S3]